MRAVLTRIDATAAEIAEADAVNAMIEDMLAGAPSTHTVPPEETRRARAEGRSWAGPLVHSDRAHDRTIETDIGPLRIRTVVPDSPRGVYLHIHGGGWVLGAADQQDALLEGIADGAGLAVASVEYRLAPEHPFPAGPDDCAAAARWLVENAAAEWGTDRLLIGGESAGAHLAAATLVRLRDDGHRGAFAAANLVFGAYDLSGTPSQRRWGTRNLILSGPIMTWFYETFVPGLDAEDRRDPAISPLYADLRDLPPALFTVGELDPLVDDTAFMAERWALAGNDVETGLYPAAIHGFVAFPTAIGRRALAQQVDFLRRHADA